MNCLSGHSSTTKQHNFKIQMLLTLQNSLPGEDQGMCPTCSQLPITTKKKKSPIHLVS